MTLEEIIKQEGRQPDCSGYVTKYDIECSDGLTIRQGAFNDDDGRKVPMVWMHDHKNLENVLGHVYLESLDDGVYGYGYMNSSPKGQLAKLYVDHGDISAFSIYANKLQKRAKDVVHGMIREVSLVLAGANRGALIDGPISHSDGDEDDGEATICMGDDYGGPIYGSEDELTVEEYLEHYGRKGMKWGKNLFKTEYEAHPRESTSENSNNHGLIGREKNVTGEGKFLWARKGKNNGLGDGKVGSGAENRPVLDWKDTIAGHMPPITGTSLSGKIDYDAIQEQINAALDAQDSNFVTENVTTWENVPTQTFDSEDANNLAYNITENIWPSVTESLGSDYNNMSDQAKESLKEQIKARISGMVMASKNAASNAGKKAKDAWSNVSEGAKGAADKAMVNVQSAKDRVSEGAKEVKEKVSENAKAAGEKATAAVNTAKERAKVGYDKASEAARGTAYRLTTGAKEAVNKVSEGAKTVGDKAKETYNKAAEGAKAAGEKVSEGAKTAAGKVSDTAKTTAEGAKEATEKVSEGVKNVLNDTKEALDKLLNTPIYSQPGTVYGATINGEHYEKKGEDKVGPTINELLDDAKSKIKSLFKHDDLSDEDAEDIIKHYIDGDVTFEEILQHAEGRTVYDVFNGMSDEEKSCVYYFLLKARQLLEDGEIKHSDKEEDEMKHNVFDDATENKENTTLSHADMEHLTADVFRDAKSKGSLKDSFMAHADDYGIDNIEYLFPDDRKVTNTPTWIKRPDSWVRKVMNSVSHSPFSRIKSIFADITEPDARARGYIKGNRKVEEVFGLLKRSTTPTTVYKKQKLDRDDIIDITDFDVVAWLKTEMRGMLDEELARAFLIGDGRSPASSDKINEQNIRPIYSDDDLFVIHKAIAVTSSTTTDAKCKEFIRQCIKARKDYRGSGNPTLYTTEDMLTDMLLMEDNMGHPLYDSQEKLATKLRVKEIVTVPVFENITRTVGSATMELMGIIVNLDDYKVGADKGGSVSMFEDFDIDYNQEKYLIETRCSGALTVPYSAIVIESSSSVFLDVDPDDPSETRYGKTVSSLQENVVVNDDSISGTLKYVTGYTGFSGDTELQSGHYLALKLDVPNGATTTLQLLNNGGSGTPVDLGTDDYAVGYIRSKNAKIVVTTTLAGVSVSKTYSLRLLKLESA